MKESLLPELFFQLDSKQSHTAHKSKNKDIKCSIVKIYYPFHPRYGERLEALYTKYIYGESHIALQQPDDTFAMLPAWMAQPEAERFELEQQSYVSLKSLCELQNLINNYHNSSEALSIQQSRGEIDEPKKPTKAAKQLSARSISGRSNKRASTRNKDKSNRTTKAVANRHLPTRK